MDRKFGNLVKGSGATTSLLLMDACRIVEVPFHLSMEIPDISLAELCILL